MTTSDVHDHDALTTGPQGVQRLVAVALGSEGDQVDTIPVGQPAEIAPSRLVTGLPGTFHRQVGTKE
jgi:hypothetical protein